MFIQEIKIIQYSTHIHSNSSTYIKRNTSILNKNTNLLHICRNILKTKKILNVGDIHFIYYIKGNHHKSRLNLFELINQQCITYMSVAGLARMSTGSVAKRPSLSRHTFENDNYLNYLNDVI